MQAKTRMTLQVNLLKTSRKLLSVVKILSCFLSVFSSLFPGGPVVVTAGFYLLSINSINVVDMVSKYFMIIFIYYVLHSKNWVTMK